MNSTGYDRTKGSKRDQGIITPKAPQNQPRRRFISTMAQVERRSFFGMIFDFFVGLFKNKESDFMKPNKKKDYVNPRGGAGYQKPFVSPKSFQMRKV